MSKVDEKVRSIMALHNSIAVEEVWRSWSKRVEHMERSGHAEIEIEVCRARRDAAAKRYHELTGEVLG